MTPAPSGPIDQFGESMVEAGQLDEMAKTASEASDLLKVLSNESRMLILCMLMIKERTVTELEQFLNMRQASVSQQLQRLRAEKIVTARREGKQIYYSLASAEAGAVIGVLYEMFCVRTPVQ